LLIILTFGTMKAQSGFSNDPLKAVFETKDADNFWKAFDKIVTSDNNPFEEYVKNGSLGVKGFTEYRIINADSLYSTVKGRQKDYLKSRNVLQGIAQKEKKLKAIYSA
jgi:hypothetical protein